MQRQDDDRVDGFAQNTASTVRDRAIEASDAGMNRAAEGVQHAAEKLRERAEVQDGVANTATVKVADGMEKTASYLREHETKDLLNNVQTFVKAHPMQSVAGAVVGTFLLSRILR